MLQRGHFKETRASSSGDASTGDHRGTGSSYDVLRDRVDDTQKLGVKETAGSSSENSPKSAYDEYSKIYISFLKQHEEGAGMLRVYQEDHQKLREEWDVENGKYLETLEKDINELSSFRSCAQNSLNRDVSIRKRRAELLAYLDIFSTIPPIADQSAIIRQAITPQENSQGMHQVILRFGRLFMSRQNSPFLVRTKAKYLKSLQNGIGKMAWHHLEHRRKCAEHHHKWDQAFHEIVRIGTRMNSEQQEYQENLWSIQKKHLQEIDNKWKGPIKEWTNRYKSITGKLPDIERTDWGSYCFAHRYHNDNFNSYLKRLISE